MFSCSLVDGVTSAQENAYTFDHYFGRDSENNDVERQDNGLAAHRGFAGDGGFLCPSGKTVQNFNILLQKLRESRFLSIEYPAVQINVVIGCVN